MSRRLLLLLASMMSSHPLHAVPLNDTGITDCYTDSAVDSVSASDPTSVAAETGTHPRQDCRFGQDSASAAGAFSKTGSGDAGFDFTALDASGNETNFSSGATPHSCVRDNVTGLTWEVKSDDNGLHDKDNTFTWYSDGIRGDGTANAMNGGGAGSENAGTCFNKYDVSTNPSGNYCDTAGFVAAVNAAGLCGYADWRMPSFDELRSIDHFGRATNPTIDSVAFPNSQSSTYWSATTFAPNPLGAFYVEFYYGSDNADFKSGAYSVRLVRGGE